MFHRLWGGLAVHVRSLQHQANFPSSKVSFNKPCFFYCLKKSLFILLPMQKVSSPMAAEGGLLAHILPLDLPCPPCLDIKCPLLLTKEVCLPCLLSLVLTCLLLLMTTFWICRLPPVIRVSHAGTSSSHPQASSRPSRPLTRLAPPTDTQRRIQQGPCQLTQAEGIRSTT